MVATAKIIGQDVDTTLWLIMMLMAPFIPPATVIWVLFGCLIRLTPSFLADFMADEEQSVPS